MLKKIQKQKARQALTVLIPLVRWGWPTTWRCICCLHVSICFFLIVFGLQLHPHIGHNSQNVSYPRPVTESLIFLSSCTTVAIKNLSWLSTTNTISEWVLSHTQKGVLQRPEEWWKLSRFSSSSQLLNKKCGKPDLQAADKKKCR